MSAQTTLLILRLVDLLALGIGLAPGIRARFDDVSGRVRRMVAEGRDPTPEEWAALDAETADLLARLSAP